MAKMSKEIRRAVFENAIKKLYGDRLLAEKAEFEKKHTEIILKMVKRTAKKNGVDFELLTTVYKPYVSKKFWFYYKTDAGFFENDLGQIFYNENLRVMKYEDACIDMVKEFSTHHIIHAEVDEAVPYTDDETFSEAEKKEFIAIYKKYADFMKEVISSACAIRDVINSASTTKQLIETLPEFAEYIPAQIEGCTALVPVETVKKVTALLRKAG
jgi:hypothetical protein